MKTCKNLRKYQKKAKLEAKRIHKTRIDVFQQKSAAYYSTRPTGEIVPTPETVPGYLSEAHIASHSRPAIDIISDQIKREEAIHFEIMEAQSKYEQYSDRKGKVVTPVTRESGVNNSCVHPIFAQYLNLMNEHLTAPQMLFSTKMTTPPINKRGKLIRPLQIYLKKADLGYERVKSSVGAARKSVILPQLVVTPKASGIE